MIQNSTDWLLDQQILTPGDWKVRAKNAQPGGWAFEFQNNHYPDIDDAGEVVMALALAELAPEGDERRKDAINRCVKWILAMQSKNGGWAAFDKDNNREVYLSKLPFSDFGEVLDPPTVDVTAHLVEMFGKLGYTLDFPPLKRAYDFIPPGTGRGRVLVRALGRQLHLWHRGRIAGAGGDWGRHAAALRAPAP